MSIGNAGERARTPRRKKGELDAHSPRFETARSRSGGLDRAGRDAVRRRAGRRRVARHAWRSIIAEAGGRIEIGRDCVVLENAVVRATARHDCFIGDSSLIGPHAHVVGAHLAGRAFIATGASVFRGAELADAVEVRINGVVHIKTKLEAGSTVPIDGSPKATPRAVSPARHGEIWAIQRSLDFPSWVYDVDRDEADVMARVGRAMSLSLASHAADETSRPEAAGDRRAPRRLCRRARL